MIAAGVLFERWRRRRRTVYQLHLVDLFALTAALAAGMAYYSYHRSQHNAEVAVLERIWATPYNVESEHLDRVWTMPKPRGRPARLPHLRVLDCRGCQFRGDGLEGMPSLEVLNLSKTAITDADLHHVARLSKLRVLSLNANPITDAAVPTL